jgi:hypothetical protein
VNHYFESITNTSGDSLIGYYARVINPSSLAVVPLSADNSGTPISVVSGIVNMAITDAYGNLSFYVEPGTYHLDIYAPNGTTFVFRVENIAMNSTKGDTGGPGPTGPANASYTAVSAIGASDPGNLSAILADAMRSGLWTWNPSDLSAKVARDPNRGFYIPPTYDTTGQQGAWVRNGEFVAVSKFFGGGSELVRNTDALNKAIDLLHTDGGGILIDVPYFLMGAIQIAPVSNGTRPVIIYGRGRGTTIGIGSACTSLIDIQASLVEIRGMDIADPNNLCSSSFIKTSITQNNQKIVLADLNFAAPGGDVSTAVAWDNVGARNCLFQGGFVQNLLGFHRNSYGGVNNTIRDVTTLGTGLDLDIGALVTSEFTSQAEGLIVSDCRFQTTRANGRGIRITAGLELAFSKVQCVLLGGGGIGCEFAVSGPGYAVAGVSFSQCYFEGTHGATNMPALKSRGNVSRVTVADSKLGTGSYAFDQVDGIDFDGVQIAKFIGVTNFYGAGRVFKCTNSEYYVDRTSDFRGGTIVNDDSGSIGAFLGEGLPYTTAHPQVDYGGRPVGYSPTIPVDGQVATNNVAKWWTYGYILHEEVTCTLPAGIAPQETITIPLKAPVNAGSRGWVGREDARTGRILQGDAANGALTVRFYDNGADFKFQAGDIVSIAGSAEMQR